MSATLENCVLIKEPQRTLFMKNTVTDSRYILTTYFSL